MAAFEDGIDPAGKPCRPGTGLHHCRGGARGREDGGGGGGGWGLGYHSKFGHDSSRCSSQGGDNQLREWDHKCRGWGRG